MKQSTLVLLAFLLLCIPALVFANDGLLQEWQKIHEGEYNRKEKIGPYGFFSNPSGRSASSSLRLWDIRPTIEGPSCQNPGFVFQFSAYVASMAEIQNYFDSALRSAILGAGLALIEETFPELSTMIKHYNALAWQKKKLEAFTCQAMLRKLTEDGVLTSKRAYVSCVEELTKDGTKRDDAEIQCSEKLSKVYDFLGVTPQPVTTFKLNNSTIKFAKRLRDTNSSKDIPDNDTLEEIEKIVGEVKVTTDGKETGRSETFVRWMSKFHKDVISQITNLVEVCINTTSFSDKKENDPFAEATCELTSETVLGYKNLKIRYPYTSAVTALITPLEIQSLANQDERLRYLLIENYAANVSIMKAEFLYNNWKNIVSLAKTLDGSEEYHKIFDTGIDNLEKQIQLFKMQQRHRMRIYKIRQNLDFSKPVNFLETNWD